MGKQIQQATGKLHERKRMIAEGFCYQVRLLMCVGFEPEFGPASNYYVRNLSDINQVLIDTGARRFEVQTISPLE